MAEWIKWTKDLAQKKQVRRLARRFKIRPLYAAAHCMQVWAWADSETADGWVDEPPEALDEIAGLNGFGRALVDVGWLVPDEGGITFPNFERHNGRSAKRRVLDQERKRRERAA